MNSARRQRLLALAIEAPAAHADGLEHARSHDASAYR